MTDDEMRIKTISDIRGMRPYYDPSRYVQEDWQGTALDVLKAEHIPAEDRLWIVLHKGWIDDRTLRLFAVWCIRRALARGANPDPRIIAVYEVAERNAS